PLCLNYKLQPPPQKQVQQRKEVSKRWLMDLLRKSIAFVLRNRNVVASKYSRDDAAVAEFDTTAVHRPHGGSHVELGARRLSPVRAGHQTATQDPFHTSGRRVSADGVGSG
ncbi:MAG: hypothetical protein ACRDRD_11695, partial [Pseudonocardiaceae bacterium]